MNQIDESRQETRKELIKISRTEKELKDRKLKILSLMADSEKNQGVLAVVDKLHKAVLENSPDLEFLISQHLTEDEKLLFLDNKYGAFFKGVQVFEKYQEHPIQKSMQKMGCIGRRTIKKQRTPNQHVGTMVEAKGLYELQRRVEVLEEISKLHTKEIKVLTDVSLMDEVGIGGSTKAKKIAFKKVKEVNPDLTQQELADLFGVSRRTIIRWSSEMQSEMSHKK